jgi:hypothetical protein
MAIVWLVCGLLTASPPAVEPTPAPAVAPAVSPRQVVVGLAGRPASFAPDALQRVLTGYLTDLDPPRTSTITTLPPGDEVLPQLAWARERARDPAVERVLWLELRDPGPHRLYLYEPRSDRVYLRELADAEPDVLLETLGVVVRALVAHLSEGTPPGMQAITVPEPAPAPAPAPEPPPPAEPARPAPVVAPRPRLHLDLALGYRGSSFAAAIPFQHGVAAQLMLVTRIGVLVGAAGGWLAPGAATRDDLRLDLTRVPLGLRIGYRLRRDHLFHIDLDLGVASELLLPRISGAPTRPRTTLAARVAVSPGLGLGLRPFNKRVPIGLHLHLQLDAWLRDLALAVRGPGGDAIVADAAPVGATLDLAVRYTFGAGRR